MRTTITCHRDGTLAYYSSVFATYVRRMCWIPYVDIQAVPPAGRDKLYAQFIRFGWSPGKTGWYFQPEGA